jgi:hypothetical protein
MRTSVPLPLFATGLGVIGLLGWWRKRNDKRKKWRCYRSRLIKFLGRPPRGGLSFALKDQELKLGAKGIA